MKRKTQYEQQKQQQQQECGQRRVPFPCSSHFFHTIQAALGRRPGGRQSSYCCRAENASTRILVDTGQTQPRREVSSVHLSAICTACSTRTTATNTSSINHTRLITIALRLRQQHLKKILPLPPLPQPWKKTQNGPTFNSRIHPRTVRSSAKPRTTNLA